MNWGDDERESLMSTGMKRDSGSAAAEPDWGRYGLSSEQQKESELRAKEAAADSYQHHGDPSEDNELFAQDQVTHTVMPYFN